MQDKQEEPRGDCPLELIYILLVKSSVMRKKRRTNGRSLAGASTRAPSQILAGCHRGIIPMRCSIVFNHVSWFVHVEWRCCKISHYMIKAHKRIIDDDIGGDDGDIFGLSVTHSGPSRFAVHTHGDAVRAVPRPWHHPHPQRRWVRENFWDLY